MRTLFATFLPTIAYWVNWFTRRPTLFAPKIRWTKSSVVMAFQFAAEMKCQEMSLFRCDCHHAEWFAFGTHACIVMVWYLRTLRAFFNDVALQCKVVCTPNLRHDTTLSAWHKENRKFSICKNFALQRTRCVKSLCEIVKEFLSFQTISMHSAALPFCLKIFPRQFPLHFFPFWDTTWTVTLGVEITLN